MTFESAQYPYALTMPAGTLNRNWRLAQRAWDGAQRIDMAGPLVDANGVDDGGLFIVGAPAPAGLEAFVTQFAGNGTRFHGCTEPAGRQEVTIGEVPAVTFSQTCAGMLFARVAMVRDAFGLGAWILASPGYEAVVMDQLVGWLGGLEWRAR